MVRSPKPSPVKPADDEVQDMCEKASEFSNCYNLVRIRMN